MPPDYCSDLDIRCQGTLTPERKVENAKQGFDKSVKTMSSQYPGLSCQLSEQQMQIYRKQEAHKHPHDSNNRRNYKKGFIQAIQCKLGTKPTGFFNPEDTKAIMAVECRLRMKPAGKISPKVLKYLNLTEESNKESLEEIHDNDGASYYPIHDTRKEISFPFDRMFIITETGERIINPDSPFRQFLEKDMVKKGLNIFGIINPKQNNSNISKNQNVECSVQCHLFLDKLEEAFKKDEDLKRINVDDGILHEAVGYAINSMLNLEKDKRKEETLKQIKDKQSAENLDSDWLHEREKASIILLALSALLKDPSYTALALQGTHYAGLKEQVMDAKSGIPVQLQKTMASLTGSSDELKNFIKTGKMGKLYYTGAVCNEMAKASAEAGGYSEAPKYIANSYWKENFKGKEFEAYFRNNFNEIEQGDLVVTLKDDSVQRIEKKHENNNKRHRSPKEYDVIRNHDRDHLLSLEGKHVNIVVAVRENNGKKEVLLAGATGTDNPNGILRSSDGKLAWKDEQTIVSSEDNYIILKSDKRFSNLHIDNAEIFKNITSFKYKNTKKQIKYQIGKNYTSESTIYLITKEKLTNFIETNKEYTYSEVLSLYNDIFNKDNTAQFITETEAKIIETFLKSKNNLPQPEQEELYISICNHYIPKSTRLKKLSNEFHKLNDRLQLVIINNYEITIPGALLKNEIHLTKEKQDIEIYRDVPEWKE